MLTMTGAQFVLSAIMAALMGAAGVLAVLSPLLGEMEEDDDEDKR